LSVELEIPCIECGATNVVNTDHAAYAHTRFCKECGALLSLVLVRSRPSSWAQDDDGQSIAHAHQGRSADSLYHAVDEIASDDADLQFLETAEIDGREEYNAHTPDFSYPEEAEVSAPSSKFLKGK